MEFCGRKQSYKKKSNKKGEKTETKRCEGLICAGKKEKRGRCGYQTYLWINQEFMSPATGFHATIWPWPCVWPYACMPPMTSHQATMEHFFWGGVYTFYFSLLKYHIFLMLPMPCCHLSSMFATSPQFSPPCPPFELEVPYLWTFVFSFYCRMFVLGDYDSMCLFLFSKLVETWVCLIRLPSPWVVYKYLI